MPLGLKASTYLKHIGGGAALGSGLVGAEGLQRRLNSVSKEDRPTKKELAIGLLSGAAVGGGVGALAGKTALKNVPSWLHGAKSKTHAKSIYRDLARKHHPDLGGNAEKMKAVNQQWEKFEKSRAFKKLSSDAFFDELFKIASLSLETP